MQMIAVDRPEVPALEVPDRFKMEIVYFMTPSGEDGAPELAAGEYWIRLDDAKEWLDSMVVEVVSPLDAASKAEVELSEDHEVWLEWMVKHEIQRVRFAV